MHFFLHPIDDQPILKITGDEVHHAHVLRLEQGEEVGVLDGKGTLVTGTVKTLDKRNLEVVVKHKKNQHPYPHVCHIAMAPTKNIDRYEWFLEKATELGVAEFTPFISENSERKIINAERLEKIMLAAMKQSGRLWLPKLNPIVSFKELMKVTSAAQKMIAHVHGEYYKTYSQSHLSSFILIGPEGDFSENELNLAYTAGYKPISFGDMRLRTETAGLFAAAHFVSQIE